MCDPHQQGNLGILGGMTEPTTSSQPQLDLPLSKVQMLEEEYTALCGPLPLDYDRTLEGALRVKALLAVLHARPRAALCLSGGGIRSATFALGVIQGLAKRRMLTQFDYLSTVSGGGYIGSWLSSWVRRSPGGIAAVQSALSREAHEPTNAKPAADTPQGQSPAPTQAPVAAGAGFGAAHDDEGADTHAIGHLRRFSNYLTPSLGLMSADTWAIASMYLRNLLVNWTVFIPLLMGVLMIPRLCIPCTHFNATPLSVVLMLAAGVVMAVVGLSATGVSVPSVAIDMRGRKRTPDEERARQRRLGQGGFLLLVFAPLALGATAMTTAWAWYRMGARDLSNVPPAWWFVIAGLAIYVLTLLGAVVVGQRKSLETKLSGYARLSLVIIYIGVGGLGGALTYLAARYLFPFPEQHPRLFVGMATPVLLAIHFITGTFYVALTSKGSDPRDDEDREWWARAGGWLLIAFVAWVGFSAIVLVMPALLTSGFWQKAIPVLGAASGAITLVLSVSSNTGATEGGKPKGKKALFSRLLLMLAAPMFIVFLVAALSYLTDYVLTGEFPSTPEEHREVLIQTPMRELALWTAAMFAVAVAAARLINVNKFSMHAMYRNRLVRAYLGASRDRGPNPFTGFDAEDNLQMYNLRGRSGGDTYISEQYLSDVPGLLKKLRDPGHWLSPRIWALCERTRVFGAGNDDSAPVRKALADDLNAIVEQGVPQPEGDTARRAGSRADRSHAYDGYIYQRRDRGRVAVSTGRRVRPPIGRISPGDATRQERNLHLLEHVYGGHILPGAQRPLHVVNVALNLVGGDQLAWQERKAESFTVSALHSGNHRLGYRRSLLYGGPDGISLGTAITISGAAVSPNMGYHSSPPLALLMTFFNVRLGWWLGNPGRAGAPDEASGRAMNVVRAIGDKIEGTGLLGGSVATSLERRSYRHSAPTYSIQPVVKEAFGLTDERSKYVYLSDGGHFENLGLYEMVLRRCRVIVLSDAGCDPSCAFEDLGNAIRKVRIDLGVEITLDLKQLYPRSDKKCEKGKYCAIGSIGYKAADGAAEDGVLIYIKPAIRGDEPADIRNYCSTRPDFPHESTGDQFFSESQFESYRTLGEHAVSQLTKLHVGEWKETWDAFVKAARTYEVYGTGASTVSA